MSKPESVTQPSEVSTEDRPRPPLDSVVTSETGPREEATDEEAAAADQASPQGEDVGSAQTAGESDPSGSDNQPSKRRRELERKLRKLKSKLTAAESARAEDKKLIEKLTGQLTELKSKVPAPSKPRLTDFKDEEEFAEAYASWKAESESPPPETPKRVPEPVVPPATTEEIEEFRTTGVEKFGDEFLEAFGNKELPISAEMGRYLVDSEMGADVYVYLAKNEDVAKEIFQEGPLEAGRLLAKVEADLESGRKKPSKAPKAKTNPPTQTERDDKGKFSKSPGKKTTRAPPPGPEHDPDGAVPDADLEKLGMEDYARVRRAQLKARNARF